jgi:hypothetical protein
LIAGLLLAGSSLAAAAQSDTSGPAEDAEPNAKRVLGWVENMRLLPQSMLMKAKLDPGARSSAIHAEEIEYFQDDDNRKMVRFTILREHDNSNSDRLVLERPLVREVAIKMRGDEGGGDAQERPAVRLEFCLAGERYNTLFTLTNRDNFNYPVLLGRQFLRNKILVDSGESFTHRTNCR